MAIKLDKIKFDILKFEFAKEDFNNAKFSKKVELDMVVDSSADYATNATEYFRKAMIGEDSTRSKFKQVLGVKDRVKLGTTAFQSLIKSGASTFDPSDSEISQKTFEVTPLMVSTSVNISDLETSFVSDQLAKGSNNFNDSFAFMNFFYETLSAEHQEEMEYLTFQGDTDGTFGTPSAYLETVDGLEKLLEADADVLTPGATAVAITSSNIIAVLKEARNTLPKAVKIKGDFVYMLSTNAFEAYMDAINENMASGQYFSESLVPNFQGVEVYHAKGTSSNVVIAGNWSNFVNVQDVISDEVGYQVVDFYKTKLDRTIGVRTDFKFTPGYLKGDEVYFYKP